MEARALWHVDDHRSLLREKVLKRPGPDECWVKAHCSMVSMGTERLVAKGNVPASLHDVMRVPYMDGHFSFPFTYGYSLAGEVIAGPREWLGEKVHLMHPHQSLCCVRVADVTVIPPEIPMERAVLASNLETAVNAVWDAQPMMGENILVIGYGLVGALIAHLLRGMSGINLFIAEIMPERRDLAEAHGWRLWTGSEPHYEGMHLVFHTSATAQGLQQGIDALLEEGRLVELSWYGQQKVHLDLGSSFHYGRKRIISSQVSRLSPHIGPTWDLAARKELVFRLLKEKEWDRFVGEAIPFLQSPAFFERLRTGVLPDLNVHLVYPD